MSAKFKNIATTIFGLFLWIMSSVSYWLLSGERRIGLGTYIVLMAVGLIMVQAWSKLLQGWAKRILGIKE